ncbi:peptidase S28 [Lepidopterella palustris CBS 459.81]|uniref:Peptidase S28 n=1 Tax=Lepidopterella palustris CBS 459.81 TaxID=1314670 RepID=A0A8E2EH07_9PEZI|nr:peptidase S28 [Lepidopterella palustris CBS 459.81]
MHSLLSLCLFSLSFLPNVNALGGSLSNKFRIMAEMGLLPDGTPMRLSEDQAIQAPSIKATKAAAAETIVAEYVTLPLDHFKSGYGSTRTFNNRFWVAESGYKPGGPIFIYDVGEADAEPSALFRLQDPNSFFKQIVDAYGGIGIAWEHRFYGNSTPVTIDLDTPAEEFTYLTAEQALADIPAFAAQFSRKNINATLTPEKTPWIFIGGSYPGMRAAFVRKFYPDTIYASFASSAPVEARTDMSVYFEPIWRGMNAYGWANCTKDIHAAINYMDGVMERPFSASALKERFLGLGAGNNTNAGFADALSTPFYLWQSYGVEGGSTGLRSFCDWLSTDPATNKTAPAEGWAASKGANFTVGRWASFPYFTDMVNSYMTTNCSGVASMEGDCDLQLRFSDPAGISWTWQYCTQWGFLQSANLGPTQLISKYNSLQHQADICHRQFPSAPPSLLPAWPAVHKTNAHFGGWAIRPSNVYWSGGEFDPWRTLSPLSSESWAPKPKPFTSPVPACGVQTQEGEIFASVIEGAEHCFDFRTSFPGGEGSREVFMGALTEWLKCFKAR